MMNAAGEDAGTMAALSTGPGKVREILGEFPDVLPVNLNGPKQTVIAGPTGSVTRAIDKARSLGIRCRELTVAAAFHTQAVASAREPLVQLASRLIVKSPSRPLFSNLDASPHPSNPADIAQRLGEQLASPVRFAETVEAIYAHGCKIFVEAGPGGTLTGLLGSILGDRPHLAISFDSPRQGIPGLLHGLAQLVVAGVRVKVDRLTCDRDVQKVDLANLPMSEMPRPSASSWVVNGSRARPINAPEMPRLGQANLPSGACLNGHGDRLNLAQEHPVRRQDGHEVPEGSRNGSAFHPKDDGLTSADRAILAFQENMTKFLEIQRETMVRYLSDQKPEPSVFQSISRDAKASGKGKPADAIHPTGTVARNETIEQPPRSNVANHRDNAPIDRKELADRLISIVQERTGYPLETLRPGLDLEADLGIDSIKRIEVLGSLREAYPTIGFGSDSTLMDELSRAKTLGTIIDRIMANQVTSGPTATIDKTPKSPQEHNPPSSNAIRRLLIESVPAPLPRRRANLVPGGTIVVTDDGRGFASGVAGELDKAGYRAILSPANMDWTSPAEVEQLVDEARRSGPLTGIVHVSPLGVRQSIGLDVSLWTSRLNSELKGLFHLARAVAPDLERAASLEGSAFLAMSAMGGSFASLNPPDDFSSAQGAIAGLVKTLAREWPEVRVRVVDFPLDARKDLLIGKIIEELFANEPRTEVGYGLSGRISLRTKPAALSGVGPPKLELKKGAPVLLTGGARGITAAIAEELACRWQPTFLLMGTTNPPAVREGAATAGIPVSELKEALHAILRKRGDASPALIERAYREVLREREIRANLDAFRSQGANVEYSKADVRDRDAVRENVNAWRSRFGPIQGLIHGAGVIHDKLLRDKTSESFDRVVATKVMGALNLISAVDPIPLKFTAMFSSIAARFGNRGQGDYAAANESLNKLAVWLDRRWPGRVISVNWGPWSEVGMVSGLEGHLGRQGLGMISPESGAKSFVDELMFGNKGEVEVLLCGSLGELETPLPRSKKLEAAGTVR